MTFDQTLAAGPPETPTDRPPAPTPTPRRRRRGLVVVGAAGLVVALALAGLARPPAESAADRGGSFELDDAGVLDGEPFPTDGAIAAAGGAADDGSEVGGGWSAGGSGVEEPPGPAQPEPPGDPEAPAQPEPPAPLPAQLQASPDPLKLHPGVYGGSFTVANVGDEPMTWTALSKPSVALSDTGGELAARSSTIVSFTVDPSALPAGSFSFKIKVTGNGGTTYVDVHGAKPVEDLAPNP